MLVRQPAPPQIAFRVGGTAEQPNASGYAIIDTTTNQAYLVADGLQPITPQQVYELWWLLPNNGGVVSVGTFTVDASGKGSHTTPVPGPASNYAGLDVSLERAPAPTDAPGGAVVMAGMYTVP
jgi:anti-sigma-K factor RskA